jgi:hypothetical protein
MPTMMSKQRPMMILSTFALMLAMGMAGCDKNGDPSVASVKPGQTNAGGGAADSAPSALKFSQCMRTQGFSWYPDPDAGGNLNVNEPQGLDRTKYQQAQTKCDAYAPWGNGNSKKSATDLDKLRKVSQCMRDAGFAKFPDPDDNGSINLNKDSGIKPTDPAFQKAQQECQKYAPLPAQQKQ